MSLFTQWALVSPVSYQVLPLPWVFSQPITSLWTNPSLLLEFSFPAHETRVAVLGRCCLTEMYHEPHV